MYCDLLVNGKGGVILKNKYFLISFFCAITDIILIICFFIGNIESNKLLPFVFINSLIYIFFNLKENKTLKEYTKYDGLKKVLSGLMVFWIVIIVFAIYGFIRH